MTTKEMIEVMQAFVEGKKIEYREKKNTEWNWDETPNPCWDWWTVDYRVKQEQKYRPFKSIEELTKTYGKICGNWASVYGTMPLVWIKPKESDGSLQEAILVTEFWSDGVCTTFSDSTIEFEKLYEEWTFLDGTPCGVKE